MTRRYDPRREDPAYWSPLPDDAGEPEGAREPRYRWAILGGALFALWCLCVGFIGWLAGWWM